MRKIYVVGGDNNYAAWMQGEIVPKMEDADLVVFTGGEDVTPALYGEPAHPSTSCNPLRDKLEANEFWNARLFDKKLVGICRGAQFLCVMAGGRLVQDQQPQPHYHWMETSDGQRILVSSTHHQAQYPWNLTYDDFLIKGYTFQLSKWHEDGRRKEIVNDTIAIDGWADGQHGIEVEVCKYLKIKALGIQPHPEYYYGHKGKDFEDSIAYFQNLLNAHMEE